ncbi:Hpt domain-containing protein [Sediminimonas qiaohouensis]|uniref:Hpt domain-containing protein n=1 Tax=Sediminimonas qiaohouensis TaxID=552061 RepID=UPI0004109D62|nr:Hpt domain-containing protein [Sediminimonas qiaohouensis]
MIDWNRIAELRDEIGAEDFSEVVSLFLEEVNQVAERLRTGVVHEELASDLHFLKGSAMNLGFSRFAVMCQAGERDAAAGRADDVDVDKILKCYDESQSEFMSELDARLSP